MTFTTVFVDGFPMYVIDRHGSPTAEAPTSAAPMPTPTGGLPVVEGSGS